MNDWYGFGSMPDLVGLGIVANPMGVPRLAAQNLGALLPANPERIMEAAAWQGGRQVAFPGLGQPLNAGENGAPVVAPSSTKALRKLAVGLGRQAIAAGATVNFTVRPQRVMRVERIIITTDANPLDVHGLEVTTVSVGVEQMLNATAVGFPAAAFAPDAFGTALSGFTAVPGQEFTVTLRSNLAGATNATVGATGYTLD